MLSRPELERVADTLTRGNVGHAEKLYLQDIILSTVSRETAGHLVFKGGTALLKCYQLDRFSEDLDFTATRPLSLGDLVDATRRDLDQYGARVAEQRIEESANARHARLGIEGPLYRGDRRSLCFIRIEVNTESTACNTQNIRYTSPFRDVPSFDLVVLEKAELLAEKIRALLTRDQPRDLYDIYHLLEQSVPIDPDLVRTKLASYDLDYDQETVIDRAGSLEARWASFEPMIYSDLPTFEKVMDVLESSLSESNE